MWTNWKPQVSQMEMCIGTATVDTVWQFLQRLNPESSQTSNPTPGGITKRDENKGRRRNSRTSDYSSRIRLSQKLETTQMCSRWGMSKPAAVPRELLTAIERTRCRTWPDLNDTAGRKRLAGSGATPFTRHTQERQTRSDRRQIRWPGKGVRVSGEWSGSVNRELLRVMKCAFTASWVHKIAPSTRFPVVNCMLWEMRLKKKIPY